MSITTTKNITSAIMQPTYIPWIGYFDLIDKVDIFVFHDDIQLAKQSWQVRNKVLGANGIQWLSIPIKKTAKTEQLLINIAEIDSPNKWLKKHLRIIKQNYYKTPFFDSVYSFLEDIYANKTLLHNLNKDIIINISKRIGISTPIINSSSLSNLNGTKDLRVANICKSIESNIYLSPQGSSGYINKTNKGGVFPENGIELFYHNYNHPEYKQLSKAFIPYLGIYDLLFNVGFDNALEVIRSGREKDIYYKEF